MKSKRHIVITGGAGFIGSHLANRFIADGHRVTVLDNLSTGLKENIPPEADFIELDLGVESSYPKMVRLECDAVFHLAGQSSGEASFDDPLYDLRSHVMSTFWLLKWCKEKGVSRFMYSSSMSVYGDPDSLPVNETHPYKPKTYYGAAKIGAEAYINFFRNQGMDTTIFRLFSVYGPGQNLANRKQGIVSIFLSYLLEGKPVVVKGPGARFRDLTHIDDVVDAWNRAYRNPVSGGKTYNLATGVKTTVEELVEMLKAAVGDREFPVRYEQGTPGDQFGIVGDITLVSRDLMWKPSVDLATGIGRMVAWGKGLNGKEGARGGR